MSHNPLIPIDIAKEDLKRLMNDWCIDYTDDEILENASDTDTPRMQAFSKVLNGIIYGRLMVKEVSSTEGLCLCHKLRKPMSTTGEHTDELCYKPMTVGHMQQLDKIKGEAGIEKSLTMIQVMTGAPMALLQRLMPQDGLLGGTISSLFLL